MAFDEAHVFLTRSELAAVVDLLTGPGLGLLASAVLAGSRMTLLSGPGKAGESILPVRSTGTA